MKKILVFDNKSLSRDILVGILKSKSNFMEILTSHDTQTALNLIAKKDINVLITGMHVPEPDVFTLSLLLSKNTKIKIFIITKNASATFCEKIKKLDSVIHFNQSLDLNFLTDRILSELQIDYGGQIRGFQLASLLQVCEAEGRSCTLLITDKGNKGTICLKDGKPIAAKTGNLTGNNAVLKILSWQDVSIEFDYKPNETAIEISIPLVKLILESSQIKDEELSKRQNLRKHIRFNCLFGVECQIDHSTYQCLMRDLSEGGAYLETEQPFKVGQELIMKLFSPISGKTCEINGIVVRRDKKGIGVQFDPSAQNQQQMIRSLIENRTSQKGSR